MPALTEQFLKGLVAGLKPNEIKDLILLQRAIESQYNIEQYTADQIAKIQRSLDRARLEIVRQIKAVPRDSYTRNTLTRRLNEILGMSVGIAIKLGDDINRVSYNVARQALKDHNDIASFGGRVVGFKNARISKELLQAQIKEIPVGGYLLKDWIDSTFTRKLKTEIQQEFLTGSFKGEGTDELARRISTAFKQISTREAVTLAKTYSQEYNVKAMELVYAKNTSIVKGVRWSAVLESGNTKTGTGTCPRCASLDGRRFSKDDLRPPCPLHPRCRCLLLPVTKDWRELGLDIDEIQKAYRPTQIVTNLGKGKREQIYQTGFLQGNYEDFFNKQSDTFKNNVVGPTRAALIANKSISFKDLVDPVTGRLLTLKELQSLK